MNKVPIKWNNLIPFLRAKEEYLSSGKAQLDYLLDRTINDLKYGTTDEELIKKIRQEKLENEMYNDAIPPINGLKEALRRLANKKSGRNPQQ